MTIIYYANFVKELNHTIFGYYLDLLPLSLRQQILKFKYRQDAQASLIGKLLLIKGLKDLQQDYELIDLKYSVFGRPYFQSAHIDFNISHAGCYVICALSTCGRIGVDLEETKPIIIENFRDQFSNAEWEDIKSSKNPLDKFYFYWTAKEATVKADGRGLNILLKNVEIKKNTAFIKDKIWHLTDLKLFKNYNVQIATNYRIEEKLIFQSVKF
ncbi:4'-phosphopantetheinyl transferase family protein [Sphingobacterium faecium]|uniref:4'-phosphopantetheinyl transferase family protein n=1 Tax=Sphingobacterium faecium TaxID=34087 RepID=UPI003209E429